MDQVNHDRRNADFASPYLSAHNVYYVKSGVVNGNPLVIYVKTGKAFFSMSLIVYVVPIYCNYKQAINITTPPFSFTHYPYQ